ncbi:mechanosensitive ion channel [Kovacikia minuta CCNUW1]|uniref:mechanosensitive ion channel n=1 Tax=Kovacikia minuta TaxID=2931930 RepID=UPI001CCE88D3|nr:mechanosensitive ion channel [Kovacikia minuta]UBF27262.1 mechanosensitive ion channel [Kovacikia minuta CCNUW1]
MHLPLFLTPLLAQSAPSDPSVPAWASFLEGFGLASLGPTIINLIGAIGILLLGWIIAALVSSGTRNLLKRTDLDNRLASALTGQPATDAKVEGVVATIVFWIIMILAIVAALNVLNLTTVSQPLNSFLNQIFAYLPRVGAAALLIALAWLVATLVRVIVVRTAQSLSLDERLSPQVSDGTSRSPFLLSRTLGDVLYWLVFLFFLPLILGALNLQGPSLMPIQNLLNDFLAALPRILKAAAIGFVGWFIARTVRQIVTSLLAATGLDQIGARIGLDRSTGGQSLSWLVGAIVYVLILIPTATAALDALQIPAISGPATEMLNQILSALPKIFTAALILIIAYVIGKFIAEMVTNLLSGVGFNNIFDWLGIQVRPPAPTPTPTSVPESVLETAPQEPVLIKESDLVPIGASRTPSEIVGIVVLVGIMLLAAVPATNVLGFEALTTVVTGLLVILGQVIVGLIVFAVGLYLANLAFHLIAGSGSSQARILGQTARVAIIALVSAMALQQIGIAPNIVNLAFGLLFGAIAVAIALAFGLGGRDVAAEQLREWLAAFKRRDPPVR